MRREKMEAGAAGRTVTDAEMAGRTAQEQREIQQEVERHEHGQRGEDRRPQEARGGAVQAGEGEQPEPPLPRQHLEKPGLEGDLNLRPRYLAPDYLGSGKLQDMTAIITGGDSGIGRAVAVLFAREGADVGIVYLSEHEDAEETRRAVEEEGRRAVLIPGDVTDPDFCRQAVQQVLSTLGKVDILVNNAAFQEHADSLEDITEEHLTAR